MIGIPAGGVPASSRRRANGRMATELRLLNHRLLITHLHHLIEIDGHQEGKLSLAHKVAFEMKFFGALG
jgi:hypothetical protein